MKTLYKYKNGNYNVSIFENGTKIRESKSDSFDSEKPESIDIKITNSCSLGKIKNGKVYSKTCGFCHEKSFNGGTHGNLENLSKAFSGHLRGQEIAVGGGNALEHPEVVNFAREMRKKDVIFNLTHNQLHLSSHKKELKTLLDEKLIYGLGVSYRGFLTKSLIEASEYSNTVIHVIAGIDNLDDVLRTAKSLKTKKILILGYKNFGNGKVFMDSLVEKNIKNWFLNLGVFCAKIREMGGQVLFDNIANDQLKVKRIFCKDEDFNAYFNGEDGTHTFYIDLPNNKFAKNSTSGLTFDTKSNTVVQMFKTIKQNNGY